MTAFPKRCVVDTNVPKTSNLALSQTIPDELIDCVEACVEAVDHVVTKGRLVLDTGDEIFDEYRQQLSMKGQPGMGDRFMKWVHDNRWNSSKVDQTSINKTGESYAEFPEHGDLKDLDISDRKFVATANAHPKRPPILQATDSKWWGWQTSLKKVGITIEFVCPTYIRTKHAKKMGD